MSGRSVTGTAGKLPDFLSVDLGRLKPFRGAVRYGHATGRVMALEGKLINSQRRERLLEADFREALEILNETPLGDFLVDASTPGGIDAGLTRFLAYAYSSLEPALPRGSLLLVFFRCRYDFHNLKALLKARAEDGEAAGLLSGLGTLEINRLRKGAADPSLLPPPYREAVRGCRELAASPSEMDTVMDRYFLEYRLDLADREGSRFISDFARAAIDLAGLKMVLRGRASGLEPGMLGEALPRGGFITPAQLLDLYAEPAEALSSRLEANRYYSGLVTILEVSGDEVRLGDFDRASDDLLVDLVRGSKRVSLGAEPVFAYLRARENEVTMVRMILMAKLIGIPPETVEKSLRKLYIE